MIGSDFISSGKYYYLVEQTTKKFFTTVKRQVEYTLANCTMGVFVFAQADGLPMPANSMPNANKLHTVVANGWKAIEYYDGMQLRPHDIVEWSCNHVAYIVGSGTNPQLYASWWTNYDGTSNGDRNMAKTSTIKETVDWFYKNYKNRFFHETSFNDECQKAGGKAKPSYVIRLDTLPQPVERDESKDQIYISVNDLRVRDEPSTKSTSYGYASKGYYDVLDITKQSDFDWYNLDSDRWVAGVSEVTYFPKKVVVVEPQEPTIDYKKLYDEQSLKLEQISKYIVQLEDDVKKLKEIL